MADATLEFLPAKLPEAINIKPGSYTKIHMDSESDLSSPETESPNEATASSDTDEQNFTPDSSAESDSVDQEERVSFYDLNENPRDKGSKKGSRISKSWDVGARGPAGLENRGVTCYMNSAIQALIHIPAISRYLNEVAKGKHKQAIKNNSVTFEMAQLYKRLSEAKKKSVYPHRMIKKLDEVNCMMSEWEQEDSHEYFMSLMGRLQEDSVPMGKKLNTSIIHDIFAGTIDQKVMCKNCQAVSTTYQDFYDLSVGITKDHNIESSIKEYFGMETLKPKGKEGYLCEKCEKVTKAYKMSSISSAPEYLTIQLKRFKFEGDSGKKVQDPVSYPIDLDLSSYSASKELLQYKLIAVIVHEGRTLSSGHYVAICRQPNNEWAEYDDDMVQKVSEKSIKRNTNAYILVYSRLTSKPRKPQAKAKAESASKPVASTPTKSKKRSAKDLPMPSSKLSKLEAKKKASEEIEDLFKKPFAV